MLRSAAKMLGLSALLYAFFFLPIGDYTLYGHVTRIAQTREAKELGGELSAAADDARRSLSQRIGQLGNPVEEREP